MAYIVCRKELASPECRFVGNANSSVCTYKKGPFRRAARVRCGRYGGSSGPGPGRRAAAAAIGDACEPGRGTEPWIMPGVDGDR